MSLFSKISLIIASLFLSLSAIADDVEIYLLDKLDGNLNHYCIDMRGFQERADINENLQTHTCYSYQGELAVDQVVNTDDIANGTFKFKAYDVCMTLNGVDAGATIGLKECSDENELQNFELTANGHIMPTVETRNPMCLTSGPSSWLGGRDGTSPHQVRTLNIQPCTDEAAKYQAWGTRSEMTE